MDKTKGARKYDKQRLFLIISVYLYVLPPPAPSCNVFEQTDRYEAVFLPLLQKIELCGCIFIGIAQREWLACKSMMEGVFLSSYLYLSVPLTTFAPLLNVLGQTDRDYPPSPSYIFWDIQTEIKTFFPLNRKKRIVRLWNYRESVEITRDVLKQYGQGLLLIISFPLTYLPPPPSSIFGTDRQIRRPDFSPVSNI